MHAAAPCHVRLTATARRAGAGARNAVVVCSQPRTSLLRHVRSRRNLRCSVRSEDGSSPSGLGQEPPKAAPPPPPPAPSAPGSSGPLVAGLAAGFGAVLFAVTKLGGGPTLSSLEGQAISYELAMTNGRPTVVEFYADWCEVCRETAPTVYTTEKEFAGEVNFVMMNVDNTKWASEMKEFGVDGIPHFVFLDPQGRSQGQIIGRLPKEVLESDLKALVKGEQLPFARYNGFASGVTAPDLRAGSNADPRSNA